MSNENECTTDTIYPFMCTHQIGGICMKGCIHKTSYSRNNFHECYWLCFPCTMVIDILTVVPFTGVYIYKKTCSEKPKVITIQPY